MGKPRHYLRSLPIALMAIMGMLLVIDGASASAATGEGRMGEMRRNGCCCVTLPAGGCCCEPATPATEVPRTAVNQSAIELRAVAVAPVRLSSPRSGCQCRAYDPVAPAGQEEPRPEHRRGDSVAGDFTGILAFAEILPTPSLPTVAPPARLSRSPLYLRNARLLI